MRQVNRIELTINWQMAESKLNGDRQTVAVSFHESCDTHRYLSATNLSATISDMTREPYIPSFSRAFHRAGTG